MPESPRRSRLVSQVLGQCGSSDLTVSEHLLGLGLHWLHSLVPCSSASAFRAFCTEVPVTSLCWGAGNHDLVLERYVRGVPHQLFILLKLRLAMSEPLNTAWWRAAQQELLVERSCRRLEARTLMRPGIHLHLALLALHVFTDLKPLCGSHSKTQRVPKRSYELGTRLELSELQPCLPTRQVLHARSPQPLARRRGNAESFSFGAACLVKLCPEELMASSCNMFTLMVNAT